MLHLPPNNCVILSDLRKQESCDLHVTVIMSELNLSQARVVKLLCYNECIGITIFTYNDHMSHDCPSDPVQPGCG